MCFFNEELLLNLSTCFIKIFVFIYRAKLIDSAESLKFKNDFQENSNGGHGHRCPPPPPPQGLYGPVIPLFFKHTKQKTV